MKLTNADRNIPKSTNRFSSYYFADDWTEADPLKTESQGDKESEHDVKYQCPMKCEGDKTYDKSGQCPLCNMLMVPAGCGFIYY